MLRSLFSGISGMRNNQTKLDVIGNNIANVNTTAFKSSRVTFQDLFCQTISNSQGPTDTTLGGVNAKMVGLGVQIGSISTNMTNGSLQNTGYNYDFAIAGEGFFVVSDQIEVDTEGVPVSPLLDQASTMPKYYTRDGSFTLDYEGNLVNSAGYRVLGYLASADSGDGDPVYLPGEDGAEGDEAFMSIDKDGIAELSESTDGSSVGGNIYPIQIPLSILVNNDNQGLVETKLTSFSIDGTGLISAVYGDTTYYLGKVAMATFSNPAGLEKQGGNLYTRSNNSGEPEYGLASSPGFGKIRQGFLEMSNVDLATEFTEMIITSRAYQANSRTIRTSDEMLQELINLKR